MPLWGIFSSFRGGVFPRVLGTSPPTRPKTAQSKRGKTNAPKRTATPAQAWIYARAGAKSPKKGHRAPAPALIHARAGAHRPVGRDSHPKSDRGERFRAPENKFRNIETKIQTNSRNYHFLCCDRQNPRLSLPQSLNISRDVGFVWDSRITTLSI